QILPGVEDVLLELDGALEMEDGGVDEAGLAQGASQEEVGEGIVREALDGPPGQVLDDAPALGEERGRDPLGHVVSVRQELAGELEQRPRALAGVARAVEILDQLARGHVELDAGEGLNGAVE